MIGKTEKNPGLSTGLKATHIGPESGATGTATAGEGSGAGAQEQAVPAAAAGLDDAVPAPTGRSEERSFEPHSHNLARSSTSAMDQSGPAVRDLADGKDRPNHRH